MNTAVGPLEDLLSSMRLRDGIMLDDSSLLHVAGWSGLAGDYQGSDAIEALFVRMEELTDHTLRTEGTRALIETDETIVIRARAHAQRPRRLLDSDLVLILSIETGVLREAWLFYADQPAVDSFWTVR